MLTSMKFIKTLFLFLLLAPSLLRAQIITTVAGNGTLGYSGDGGQATAASIEDPWYVICDKKGNIYFSEVSFHIVRKVDKAGVITTFAGNGTYGHSGDGGPATDAQLFDPIGIARDAIGNMYIAEEGSSCIRKVDTNGIISTVAGTATPGYNGDGIVATTAQLKYPFDIALDSFGNIYIADNGNYRVRKIDVSGIITTIAGNGTAGYSGDHGSATSAQLHPLAITLDKKMNIYISDTAHRIRKIDTSGVINTFAGTGIAGFSGDGGAASAALINDPHQLAVDDSGYIYISLGYDHRIRKVSPSGIISTIAGNGLPGYSGDGGNPLSAEFLMPFGVAISRDRKIYIVDRTNARIRCVGSDTTLATANISTEATQLLVMPNPLQGSEVSITLKYPEAADVRFMVYNLLCQLVFQVETTTNTKVVWLPHDPAGMYYIQAVTPLNTFTQQLIIR